MQTVVGDNVIFPRPVSEHSREGRTNEYAELHRYAKTHSSTTAFVTSTLLLQSSYKPSA